MSRKLPSFQFYPGDWMKDSNLRRCTHAAKGVWIDMLCLMFDSEQRGVLATAGRAWSDSEIALAVGGDHDVTLACIAELTLKGVANRTEGGALYSKRLVRDEHKRRLCSEAGKRGGNPTLKGHAKGAPKRNPTPSSSSSSSDKPLSPLLEGGEGELLGQFTGYTQAFEMVWAAYPAGRRSKKVKAIAAWRAATESLSQRFNGELRKAEDWLHDRMLAFCKSPMAHGTFCPSIAKWIEEGHYDDAPEVWLDGGDRRDTPQAPPKPQPKPQLRIEPAKWT